ncbi:MAG: hypothetical protein PHV49_06405, partial [Alistipes sp.]|nr:hypothetical protein [Alistipes sp.]
MKKTIIFLGALALTLTASAQQKEGDLNRQMDVTRDYEPTVDAASKQSMKPNMVDTVTLRPEIHYGINPIPISYGFQVKPINPVSVHLDDLREDTPLYLKLGVGVPFQSLFNGAFSSTENRRGKWGVLLNHTGSWSKLDNMNQQKTPASQTFNRVEIFGERRVKRFGFGGALTYDYQQVSRYGYDTTLTPVLTGFTTQSLDASASALRATYSAVQGKLFVGHAFTDLSYFNVRFGINGAYFADHFDRREAEGGATLDLGKEFGGKHTATLNLSYAHHQGSGELSLHKENIISVTPMYQFANEKLTFGLGVNYTYHNETDRNEGVVFPMANLRWRISRGFTPYLQIDGNYQDNDYRSWATHVNPYIWEKADIRNTSIYNGRIGIQGSVASSFAYRVYGGVSQYRNFNYAQNLYLYQQNTAMHTFTPLYQGNVFAYGQSDVTAWTIGGEIEGRVSNTFGVEFGMQYYGYSVKEIAGYKPKTGLSNLTANLEFRYNYKDKFQARAGVTMYGPKDCERILVLDVADPSSITAFTTLPPEHVNMQADVYLNLEYNITRKIGVFLEGRNL